MNLFPIPKLNELALEPNKAASLSADAVEGLLAKCTLIQSALVNRLLVLRCASNGNGESREGDRWLSAKEVADRMGVCIDYVYKNASGFPFAVKEGRRVLFSKRGLEHYLQEKMKKKMNDM